MDALDQLWVAWQPIVDIAAGTVLGYEALIRGPDDGPLAMPAALFAWAEAAGRAANLDAACKRLAYETAQGRWADPAQRLFLNVDTRWASLPDPWEQGRPGEIPLAVEVSEARSVLEDDVLLAAVARWRQAGHLVVIDDYGTGYAGPGEVLALQPDIIKLDRILIAGIDHDVQKQSLVRAISGWTDDMGIGLLAEGVETAEEWASVRRLGCDYAQGFYLGRPEAARLPAGVTPRAAVPARARPPEASRPAIHPVLAWYGRALAEAPIPSYVVDRRRGMVAWNRAAEELLGYPADQLVGQQCMQSPLDHRNAAGRLLCRGFCPLVHSMAEQTAHAAVVSVARADGTRETLEVWVTPLVDGASGRVVGALEQFRPWRADVGALQDRAGAPSAAAEGPAATRPTALGMAQPPVSPDPHGSQRDAVAAGDPEETWLRVVAPS